MFSTSPGSLETVLRTRASDSVIMMSGYFMRGDNTEKVWKYVSFFSCGPLKTPRDIDIGCVRTHGDPDSSYPFCCPQIVCQWYMWQVQYIFLINYSSSSVWRNSSIKMKVGRQGQAGVVSWYSDVDLPRVLLTVSQDERAGHGYYKSVTVSSPVWAAHTTDPALMTNILSWNTQHFPHFTWGRFPTKNILKVNGISDFRGLYPPPWRIINFWGGCSGSPEIYYCV